MIFFNELKLSLANWCGIREIRVHDTTQSLIIFLKQHTLKCFKKKFITYFFIQIVTTVVCAVYSCFISDLSLLACGAVCGSSAHAALPRNPVMNSLMHAVMKLASQVPPDNNGIHALSFSLIANLSISRDCRGVLQKVQCMLCSM